MIAALNSSFGLNGIHRCSQWLLVFQHFLGKINSKRTNQDIGPFPPVIQVKHWSGNWAGRKVQLVPREVPIHVKLVAPEKTSKSSQAPPDSLWKSNVAGWKILYQWRCLAGKILYKWWISNGCVWSSRFHCIWGAAQLIHAGAIGANHQEKITRFRHQRFHNPQGPRVSHPVCCSRVSNILQYIQKICFEHPIPPLYHQCSIPYQRFVLGGNWW